MSSLNSQIPSQTAILLYSSPNTRSKQFELKMTARNQFSTFEPEPKTEKDIEQEFILNQNELELNEIENKVNISLQSNENELNFTLPNAQIVPTENGEYEIANEQVDMEQNQEYCINSEKPEKSAQKTTFPTRDRNPKTCRYCSKNVIDLRRHLNKCHSELSRYQVMKIVAEEKKFRKDIKKNPSPSARRVLLCPFVLPESEQPCSRPIVEYKLYQHLKFYHGINPKAPEHVDLLRQARANPFTVKLGNPILNSSSPKSNDMLQQQIITSNTEDFANNVFPIGVTNKLINAKPCIQSDDRNISVVGPFPAYTNVFSNIVTQSAPVITTAPTITYTNGQQLLLAPANMFHSPINSKLGASPQNGVPNSGEIEHNNSNLMTAYSLPHITTTIINDPDQQVSPDQLPSTSNSSVSDFQHNSNLTVPPVCHLLSIGLNLAVERSQLLNLVTPQETTCRISKQDSKYIYISIPELAIDLQMNTFNVK